MVRVSVNQQGKNRIPFGLTGMKFGYSKIEAGKKSQPL